MRNTQILQNPRTNDASREGVDGHTSERSKAKKVGEKAEKETKIQKKGFKGGNARDVPSKQKGNIAFPFRGISRAHTRKTSTECHAAGRHDLEELGIRGRGDR